MIYPHQTEERISILEAGLIMIILSIARVVHNVRDPSYVIQCRLIQTEPLVQAGVITGATDQFKVCGFYFLSHNRSPGKILNHETEIILGNTATG